MLQVIYYIIISLVSLLMAYGFFRKRKVEDLVCFAVVLVTFALRALHIK